MGEQRPSSFDVLRLPIRMKLGAALAVPLLPILIVTVLEVRQASAEVQQVRTETELATAATGPAGVVNTLQDERNWMALEVNGLEEQYEVGPAVVGFEATRAATDEAVAAFRADAEAKGGIIEEVYSPVLEALGEVEAIRRDIDAYTGPKTLDSMPFVAEVYDRYSVLIAQALDANSRITLELSDVELRQGTELAD